MSIENQITIESIIDDYYEWFNNSNDLLLFLRAGIFMFNPLYIIGTMTQIE